MALDAKHQVSLDCLDDALRNARKPSTNLLPKIINGACIRVPVLARAERLNRTIRLGEIGAWTEATFALIELELPLWRVRPWSTKMASGCARCRGSRICR
jgi:hypothetical protein